MRHIYHANFWFALNWLRDPLFLPPNVYITIQVSNYDYFLGWVCSGALVLSAVLVFQTYVEPVEEEKDASISSLSGSSHQVEPGEQNDCTVEDQRNSFSR